jgi:hypothetical protein
MNKHPPPQKKNPKESTNSRRSEPAFKDSNYPWHDSTYHQGRTRNASPGRSSRTGSVLQSRLRGTPNNHRWGMSGTNACPFSERYHGTKWVNSQSELKTAQVNQGNCATHVATSNQQSNAKRSSYVELCALVMLCTPMTASRSVFAWGGGEGDGKRKHTTF